MAIPPPLSFSAMTPAEDSNVTTPNGSSTISSAQSSPSTPLTSTSTLQEGTPHQSQFTSPPYVRETYSPKDALDDLPGVSYALQLFLESHMLESEEYCHKSDPKKSAIPLQVRSDSDCFASQRATLLCHRFRTDTMCQGSHVVQRRGPFSLRSSIYNALTPFYQDLLSAIAHTRHGNAIAHQHRKPAASLTSRLASYVVGSLNATGVGFVKTMTPVERHAELVYAESLFEKALLGIVYSGDWLAFIKEAYVSSCLILSSSPKFTLEQS